MTFRCRDVQVPGHLSAERVNFSNFLFLLFHLISKNIANWNISVNAFTAKNACRKYVQIIIDKKRN